MAENIEKEIITAPELPNVIKGDGRYVMSQIRKYLKEVALQVNLANGFTADEINPSESGLAAPANFVLQFDSLGGHFSWRHVTYLDELLYYELRTDDHVGSEVGLLERTQETKSDKMPAYASGTVYLYAVLKDGRYSSGSVLSYNKKRPEQPQDISMNKNEQGILITYTYVPLDCIGAHIYINGIMYETDDNIFLYTGDSETVDKIEVAYYDNFGEGERAILYLVVPNVTDFIVERNGAMLDFHWTGVDVYNVGYVVKVANIPSWESGTELFRTTKTSNKIEYPNTGDLYFMIKAYDPHGVYSSDASWYLLTTVEDISRNHIMDFDQYDTRYGGNKINMWYDDEAGGLRLTEDTFEGEYLFRGELPQQYRARNWHEETISAIENSNLRVIDLDFSIIDEKAAYVTCMGGIIGNADSVSIKSQIARYTGDSSNSLFIANLNGTLKDSKGNLPVESQNADSYDYGRYDLGLSADDLTRLKYSLKSTSKTFGFIFHIKVLNGVGRSVFARLSCENGWLEIGYDGVFYVEGSDGKRAECYAEIRSPDYISFGISQSETERAIYISNINIYPSLEREFEENVYEGRVEAAPIGSFDTIQFYK